MRVDPTGAAGLVVVEKEHRAPARGGERAVARRGDPAHRLAHDRERYREVADQRADRFARVVLARVLHHEHVPGDVRALFRNARECAQQPRAPVPRADRDGQCGLGLRHLTSVASR